ncbi:protein ECT2 isoform X4 [Bradysia coprophila]|uniref:protein ECT2 isoform X4 n=1 Tax=Bradysia coprophila TaxID=38358 RepID=UPI00187D909E|nr:protein ECT2 isoform X4 [Bradysia coprophila]
MMNKLSNEDLPANSANADHADTITDEQKANNDIASKKRICLVGAVANDSATKELAETFGVPVETSDTGIEKLSEREWITYFIIRDFSGPVFEDLQKSIHDGRKLEKDLRKRLHGEEREIDFGRILSPIALQHATKDGLIPHGNHPIYNYSMQGVVACFAGLRKKDQLIQLLNQIHWMGGSVRDNIMNSKVTHLICEKIPRLTREDDERRKINKYKYAIAFGLAVIKPDWVNEAWEQRDVNRFSPINADFTRPHKLKAFEGHKICFLGFATEEHDHMIDVLNRNGGVHATIDDPECTHVVVDDRATQSKPEPKNSETVIVKSDWFWYTIQNGYADEKDHLFENYLERICNVSKTDRRDSLPNRKRKLLHLTPADSTPRGLLKRRSSVSDVGLLSGSLLDYTASPNVKNDIKELDISTEPKKKTMRYNHFMDLFGTESNYVDILNTITTLFYEPLKEMADTKNALINISEIKSIFNNFSPIYDVHKEMLDKFRELQEGWSEECLIGKIILDHREALIKAYPPYVNFFEQMKETLAQCDTQNPRFHAFLKINQTKAECGRQSLQDLMIRPVQRLPSISLLISDILKHTPKTNPDFKELEQALKAIKEVMTYINEDKRKTEGRLALFDIFNDIDNCPPDLVSSHRRFVSKCEVTELSNNLSGRDDPLMLFLFTDYMEICKIKKHRFNSAKSPTFGTTGLNTARVSHQKSYKHIKLLPLSSIAVVYDVQDSPRAFALPHKDKMYSFSICDDIEKIIYLKSLCKQLAENACRADAEQFLRSYESHELGIDVSDINVGTLKKAFNYARTRLKVTRAFSFHKTPMKMKRSATTSPIFGSTNSLTPATQLAQMKLASCTNINEVGETDEDEETSHRNHLVAPHSVLPTRKSKSATLSMAALRRL